MNNMVRRATVAAVVVVGVLMGPAMGAGQALSAKPGGAAEAVTDAADVSDLHAWLRYIQPKLSPLSEFALG